MYLTYKMKNNLYKVLTTTKIKYIIGKNGNGIKLKRNTTSVNYLTETYLPANHDEYTS